MKKSLLILGLVCSMGAVFANDEIAIVDLQQLVNSSAQVKQLQTEHNKKISELDKIIINARGEISNVSSKISSLYIL